MNQSNEFERLESALLRVGREMEFPVTPALAARVRAQISRDVSAAQNANALPQSWLRVAVPVALAIVLALALLFALPNARDAIGQFLGLRGLQIFYVTPTPIAPATTTGTPTAHSTGTRSPATRSPLTPLPTGEGNVAQLTPRASRTPTVRPFTLCCEVSLEEAQRRARFKLLIPPGDAPSKVYYQKIFDEGEQVVMVFGDTEHPRFTLYQAQRWIYGKLLGKMTGGGTVLEETTVDGERALWFSGAPHVVLMLDANGDPIYESKRTVDANTLVWETGNEYDGIIYRIETKLTLDETVRIAESLVQVP